MDRSSYFCAYCEKKACKDNGNDYPCGCATQDLDVSEQILQYQTTDVDIAKPAAKTSADYTLTRIEEIMAFARECGYCKIGLAFCSALAKEAKITAKIFKANGFSVESVICKAGNLHKDVFGMDGSKLLCNPNGQAELLNRAGTELNVVLGLCVGHDTLFFRHSKAPVTVLSVKDRVLGHNPLAAVYMADTFYKQRLFEGRYRHEEEKK